MSKCPLCSHENSSLFDQDKQRSFYLCGNCTLVFVPRDALLGPEDEKKRYEAHENSASDPGYVSYLKKITDAALPYLSRGGEGLDFGCGKTKVLGEHFLQAGMKMDSYDLYFHPDESIWQKDYHFIILSEVIEHLGEPLEVMRKLHQRLRPGGVFLIKTKLYPPRQEDFRHWFYKRDLTHVQFFSEGSFSKLSQELGLLPPQKIGDDLYLFKK